MTTRGVVISGLPEGAASTSGSGSRAARAGASASVAAPAKRPRAAGGGKRLKHLAAACRQLYVMLKAGTPLVSALDGLSRQSRDEAWKGTMDDVRCRVEEGATLAQAMAAYPKQFDRVTCALVSAGERSGRLPEMVDRIASLAHKELKLRGGIRGALIYPALLVGVVSLVMSLTLTVVVPRFAAMFETLSVPLPLTTQVMVWMSDGFRGYWFLVLPGVVATLVGGGWWLRTGSGKRALDAALVRLPIFGPVARAFATARMVRLIAELLDSHLPLIEVLELVRETTPNHRYRAVLDRALEAVTRGEAMSVGFDDVALIDASVYEAMRSGEATGQIASSLLTVADFLEEENEAVVRNLTTLMEPIILIVLGLVVGVLAMSLFMPLFDLTAVAGEGA